MRPEAREYALLVREEASVKPLLLRFIRRTPRSTQACRSELDRISGGKVSSMETEELLEELRREGEIAFANGDWYALDASSQPRAKAPQRPHPKQLPLFPDAQGRRLTGHERMMERIGDIARAARRRA